MKRSGVWTGCYMVISSWTQSHRATKSVRTMHNASLSLRITAFPSSSSAWPLAGPELPPHPASLEELIYRELHNHSILAETNRTDGRWRWNKEQEETARSNTFRRTWSYNYKKCSPNAISMGNGKDREGKEKLYMVINGKEQPIRQSLGASRLYTMGILKRKKVPLCPVTAESLLQNSLLHLYLPALISLPTLQTPNCPFQDLLLPSTEDLCHLDHHDSALTKGLVLKSWLSAPLCGNLPIIHHEPVNWAPNVLLEERRRFYMQQKRS